MPNSQFVQRLFSDVVSTTEVTYYQGRRIIVFNRFKRLISMFRPFNRLKRLRTTMKYDNLSRVTEKYGHGFRGARNKE
jgi:hypothetical protein